MPHHPLHPQRRRRSRPTIAPHQNLVEVLQQRFDLFGARESCAQGLCGCCTVLVDGARGVGLPVSRRLRGRHATVVTIEHLAAGGELDPIQQAFIECGAFQCGFCTPGFILMAGQLLAEHPDPDDDEIRHYLAGNLCRCAAYPEIIAGREAGRAQHAQRCMMQAS